MSTSAPAAAARRTPPSRARRREQLAGWGFVAPFALLFFLCFVIPIGVSIYSSFFRTMPSGDGLYGGTLENTFVGLRNYIEIASGARFWRGMGRVLLFGIVQVPLMILAALGLALLLDSPMIKRVVDGNSEMKTAQVITKRPEEVALAISTHIKRRITADKRYLFEEGIGFEDEIHQLAFTVARLEEAEVSELVLDADPDAIIVFTEVSSLHGGVYEEQTDHH